MDENGELDRVRVLYADWNPLVAVPAKDFGASPSMTVTSSSRELDFVSPYNAVPILSGGVPSSHPWTPEFVHNLQFFTPNSQPLPIVGCSGSDGTGTPRRRRRPESESPKNAEQTEKKQCLPDQVTDDPKENYVHVRARRGQATNSHSLAERVRREKISERMKMLQELVPGCSKITGKAVMLDEIINYVQSLQQQVEFLSMKLATVNPELSIDIDRLLPKGVTPPPPPPQNHSAAPDFITDPSVLRLDHPYASRSSPQEQSVTGQFHQFYQSIWGDPNSSMENAGPGM